MKTGSVWGKLWLTDRLHAYVHTLQAQTPSQQDIRHKFIILCFSPTQILLHPSNNPHTPQQAQNGGSL